MTKIYTLENSFLELKFSNYGAELCSIKSKKSNREFLWQADPQFWNRHSPILFPIVGKVWDGKYRVDDKEYHLPQHGFARDSVFELIEQKENWISFSLKASENTLEKYPFLFELIVSYRLEDKTISIEWTVKNLDNKDIYFQIGAHPAFNYYEPQKDIKGYIGIDNVKSIESETLNSDGYLCPDHKYTIMLEDHLFCIKDSSFHGKTWILEKNQAQIVELYSPEKTAFLRLNFDSPVLGIWSPAKDNSPFICIEPWYGRCDKENYYGEFKNKDYNNKLAKEGIFNTSYTISILKD